MTPTIYIHSQLMDFSAPKIMGIMNATPDSFAVHCSVSDQSALLAYARTLIDGGADIIDIGACSTRPGAAAVDTEEEWNRLKVALATVKSAYPQIPISIDTFRAEIVRRAYADFGIDMVNDVSGLADEAMLPTLQQISVPYILTHPRGEGMLSFFSYQLDRLHQAGVADVIIDPGLGFGKTLSQNYTILREINQLHLLACPIIVGLSRKSMIYNTLGVTAQEALNGTTAAHMAALRGGVHLLRVHDVREAKQAIQIYTTIYG